MEPGDVLGGIDMIDGLVFEKTQEQIEAEKAFITLMDTLAEIVENEWKIALPKDKLTIVDVGAGDMPYGLALEQWAKGRAQKETVAAIDVYYSQNPAHHFYYPAKYGTDTEIIPIPSFLETSRHLLEKEGITKIDFLTLFNPNPGRSLPNFRHIKKLCKDAPILGALDGHYPEFELAMERQGYMIAATRQVSPSQLTVLAGFGDLTHRFSPLFVAIPEDLASRQAVYTANRPR